MNVGFIRILLLAGWITLSVSSTWAQSVSYFRQDGGVAAGDHELPDDLSDSQSLVWRQPLAPGHSTPCLHGNSIFLTTYEEEYQRLSTVALRRDNGQVRWTRPLPVERIEEFHSVGSPAASSPACDEERVYVFFGSFGLVAYDHAGKRVWTHPMGPFQDEFGTSSSPIVADGKVILIEDHDIDSFVVAIDQKTGKEVWKSTREGFTRSYASPVLWEVDGRKLVVVAGALQLIAYDLSDGRPVWWVDGLSRIVDTTPAVVGNLLYLATWTPGGDVTRRISMEPFTEALEKFDQDSDNRITESELPEGPVLTRFFRMDLDQDGALDRQEWEKYSQVFELAQNVALSIRSGGHGNVTETHVNWIQRKGLPVVPSPVIYQDAMYMIKENGVVTCLDAATGNILRRQRIPGLGKYYASPVAGDGKVYVASERGVVSVLQVAKSMEVISSRDFKERIMATPVFDDGRIYLRTEAALYCFVSRK